MALASLLLAGCTLSLLSGCKEGCVEGEGIVGSEKAKARETAPLDEGKETQSLVNLNGLGVRVSGPQHHPCEAPCEVPVLRIMRGTLGSMVTFKTNHQHLAQWHELVDHPDQQHLLQEGLSGIIHQLLCWSLFLRPHPGPRENNSLLNSSHYYIFPGVFLLRLGAAEAKTREGFLTTA